MRIPGVVSRIVVTMWLAVVGTLANATEVEPSPIPDRPQQTILAQGMGGMMGGGPQAMMQQRWGNRLPQATDPSLLPEPDSAGARLLVQYCSQCHGVPAPGLHTAAEWPQVLGRMEMRMRSPGGGMMGGGMMGGGMMGGGMMGGGMMGGGMMGVALPTGEEWDVLLAYLQQYAQKPIEAGRYPDLNTRAGEALRTFCTQCHALPDPRQHTAKDWPAVVARMRGYMGPMGKMIPGETATKEIIDFLQRHGARTR